jgi:O-acetyl-ADP-ribose deacetylase (regulator of RNase III)
MNINYVIGDATHPIGEGQKLILHIVNDKNKWGLGFVLSLSKRWKEPEKLYREQNNYVLGKIQMTRVENDICVVNMIAQHDIKPTKDSNGSIVPPIRYDALKACLMIINAIAVRTHATIHMPKIGSGLAGGNWDIIEQIIKEIITVDTTVYFLK